MEITCPYCFSKFSDDKVHFRSEKVNRGECPDIPDDYDDYDDFFINFRGSASERNDILAKCEEWNFFKEGHDKKYDDFWNEYGGSTSERINPNRASYRNKVIDPSNEAHQRYLKKADDDGYLKKEDGFTVGIVLKNGKLCTQRVCPDCHNPLPSQYGKNESKFIAVVGITGSGKTVYLSQLIKGFEDYVAKVGMSALLTNDAPRLFLKDFPVNTRTSLPGSTPPERFLQPLFYDLARSDEYGNLRSYTFVIYDVAGENCVLESESGWFGHFIGHMQGIFLLIDPMQFDVFINADETGDMVEKIRATDVLSAIDKFITHGGNNKCDVPMAVCIPKTDMPIVQAVLDSRLADALMDEVESVTDVNGDALPMYNSEAYNPIARQLHDFIKKTDAALEKTLRDRYECYNYFAFTSLGCGVTDNVPDGPILPKRIEEPLLWLFHKFGFIDANPPVVEYGKPLCPECKDSLYVRRLAEHERDVVEKRGLFKKETVHYNYRCEKCMTYIP